MSRAGDRLAVRRQPRDDDAIARQRRISSNRDMDNPHPEAPRRRRWKLYLITAAVAIGVAVAGIRDFFRGDPAFVARPTPAVLQAVRDLARLETTELHIEKVIDLTDKQSAFFGLITGEDTVLLVAVGEVSVGVDLSKLSVEDVQVDGAGGVRVRLPEPEVFRVYLDDAHTYVYKRTTTLFARRNEQLESRARVEAVAAVERAARETDALERSKRVADRQVRTLLEKLGFKSIDVRWHGVI
jgi:hypothetical protein